MSTKPDHKRKRRPRRERFEEFKQQAARLVIEEGRAGHWLRRRVDLVPTCPPTARLGHEHETPDKLAEDARMPASGELRTTHDARHTSALTTTHHAPRTSHLT